MRAREPRFDGAESLLCADCLRSEDASYVMASASGLRRRGDVLPGRAGWLRCLYAWFRRRRLSVDAGRLRPLAGNSGSPWDADGAVLRVGVGSRSAVELATAAGAAGAVPVPGVIDRV